jgi:hypothetical protein
MTQIMYCQCRLAKKTESGESIQHSWIPQKYAIVGKILRLGNDNGWRVTHVWETETEEIVKARERAYKRWREVTDI